MNDDKVKVILGTLSVFYILHKSRVLHYLYYRYIKTPDQLYLNSDQYTFKKTIQKIIENKPMKLIEINIIEDHIRNVDFFRFILLQKLTSNPKYDKKNRKGSKFDQGFPGDLFISYFESDYMLVFNKYPLAKNHILLVDRSLCPQSLNLTIHDLFAMFCLADRLDGFSFYNSDPRSGASVSQRHFQVIPNSAGFERRIGEMDELSARGEKNIGYLQNYVHSFHPLSQNITNSELFLCFEDAVKSVGWTLKSKFSFNLILNRNWLLIVARKDEFVMEGVTANSLSILGSFATNDREKYEQLKGMTISQLYQKILIDRNDPIIGYPHLSFHKDEDDQ